MFIYLVRLYTLKDISSNKIKTENFVLTIVFLLIRYKLAVRGSHQANRV